MLVGEIEILRAAHQMMKRYGKRAAHEAGVRANSARAQGDMQNYETWQSICMWIQEIERKKPLEGEATH